MKMKRVYLAGPDVFVKGDLEPGYIKKAACREYGFEPLFPADNEIPGLEKMSSVEARRAIFCANATMLTKADIVLANLTPYEGVGADPGTVWEVGYAYAYRLPVHGYSGVEASQHTRAERYRSLYGIYDKYIVPHTESENFGDASDNLMITECLASFHALDEDHCYTTLPAYTAFLQALRAMAARYGTA